MAQQTIHPLYSSTPVDHDDNRGLPTRRARRPASAGQVPARTRAAGQVVVLEYAGRLGDLVAELDQAIGLALAEGPRGIICDLSAVTYGHEPAALAMLATAGRHVRDWPGIPVALVCPDAGIRQALAADPLGRHLILTASMASAASTVLASPVPDVRWLRLTSHPTSSRAARNFVTGTLIEWGLGPLVDSASLVVSELVTNSIIHAGTDIEVSVAWHLGALRLTVRDNSPDLPRPRIARRDEHGRGLTVVTALSRAFGVLPTTEGGKVVWAVLNAAWPHPTASPPRHEPGTTSRLGSPIVPGPRGLAIAPGPARSEPATG
jgi:anti-sigma regulatory factor (Ser/Thr protein kinase)